MGLGSSDQFFLDPSDENAKQNAIMPPPPPPDPQALLAEAQAEALKVEQQRLAKADDMKAQTDQMKISGSKEQRRSSRQHQEHGGRYTRA